MAGFSPREKSLLFLRFSRYLRTFPGPSWFFFFGKSRILLNLLFLQFLRYLSWVFLAHKKNPCYFCGFRDICGHFRALLGFFFSVSLEFC